MGPIVPQALRGPSTRISSPIGGRSCESRTPTARLTRRSAYIGPMATIPTSPPIPLAPAGAPAGGSYWFTTGDPGPARPPLGADGAVGRRHRRRRVHRAVGGDPRCSTPTRRCASSVLEADRVGWGASGRNGGFCAASLTHGLGNGLLHFPDEIDVLEAEGAPQPRRAGRVRPRRGDRLRARADGGARRRDRAVAGRRSSRRGSSSRRGTAPTLDVPRPRRGPGRGPLAALPGRRPRRAATAP